MSERYVLVVTLWLHPGQEEAFDAFERESARIMARHKGRIDQAVRLAQPDGGAGQGAYEIHVVSFPDRAAHEAYRADPEVVKLRPRREQIIARTVVLAGHEAGPY